MHVCSVCCQDASIHPSRCWAGCDHWPALCCPGCLCGSFEDAHPESH